MGKKPDGRAGRRDVAKTPRLKIGFVRRIGHKEAEPAFRTAINIAKQQGVPALPHLQTRARAPKVTHLR